MVRPGQPVFKDYDGLGFRVPLLIVSPYARHGYVTHVQYETASVLRFIEDNFGLVPLAASDQRAADPVGDALNYNQSPRRFKEDCGARTRDFGRGARERGSTAENPQRSWETTKGKAADLFGGPFFRVAERKLELPLGAGAVGRGFALIARAWNAAGEAVQAARGPE